MARAIGMKRHYFQPKSTPHYDICLTKRAQAIALGAQVVDRRGLVGVIRRLRDGS